MSAVVDPGAARTLCETLEEWAPSARNAADVNGDPIPLSTLWTRALRAHPAARVVEDAGARRELYAIEPELAERLGLFMDWDLEREAQLRGSLAAQPSALSARRGADSEPREQAHAALTLALAPSSAGLLALAADAPAPRPKKRAALASAGGLFIPSAAMVEQIGLGILDPTALIEPELEAPETAETPEPPPPTGALAELMAALAEAVLGRAPGRHADWAVARAAAHVADFRPRRLALLGRLSGIQALPLDRPGVPLLRPGAAVWPEHDAHATVAHLYSAGGLAVRPELGAALALNASSDIFLRAGLEERTLEPHKAQRSLALACAGLALDAAFGLLAKGDPDALDKCYRTHGFGSPDSAWLEGWAAAPGLARAPGEGRAIYPHTAELWRSWVAGAAVAERLRAHFDEDWFRNPRATPEALADPSWFNAHPDPAQLLGWLSAAARL